MHHKWTSSLPDSRISLALGTLLKLHLSNRNKRFQWHFWSILSAWPLFMSFCVCVCHRHYCNLWALIQSWLASIFFCLLNAITSAGLFCRLVNLTVEVTRPCLFCLNPYLGISLDTRPRLFSIHDRPCSRSCFLVTSTWIRSLFVSFETVNARRSDAFVAGFIALQHTIFCCSLMAHHPSAKCGSAVTCSRQCILVPGPPFSSFLSFFLSSFLPSFLPPFLSSLLLFFFSFFLPSFLIFRLSTASDCRRVLYPPWLHPPCSAGHFLFFSCGRFFLPRRGRLTAIQHVKYTYGVRHVLSFAPFRLRIVRVVIDKIVLLEFTCCCSLKLAMLALSVFRLIYLSAWPTSILFPLPLSLG